MKTGSFFEEKTGKMAIAEEKWIEIEIFLGNYILCLSCILIFALQYFSFFQIRCKMNKKQEQYPNETDARTALTLNILMELTTENAAPLPGSLSKAISPPMDLAKIRPIASP